jgi:hypothetical protein
MIAVASIGPASPAAGVYQKMRWTSWKSAKNFRDGGLGKSTMAKRATIRPTEPTTALQSFADRWIGQTCTYAVRLSSPVEAVALAWRLTPGAVTAAEWRIQPQNFERSP